MRCRGAGYGIREGPRVRLGIVFWVGEHICGWYVHHREEDFFGRNTFTTVNEGYLECAVCGTIFRGWLSKYWAGIPERGKGEREGARQVLFGQLAVRGKVRHGCVVMDPRGFPDCASTWTPSVRSRVRLATGLLLSRTRHLSILYGASLTLVIGVLLPQRHFELPGGWLQVWLTCGKC